MTSSLLDYKVGDKLEVHSVACGKKIKVRLCELGIFEGSQIELLKNDNFGPLIIRVFNSKLAIGRGEANKIYAKKI
jgi:ferrous iron transport protein A